MTGPSAAGGSRQEAFVVMEAGDRCENLRTGALTSVSDEQASQQRAITAFAWSAVVGAAAVAAIGMVFAYVVVAAAPGRQTSDPGSGDVPRR